MQNPQLTTESVANVSAPADPRPSRDPRTSLLRRRRLIAIVFMFLVLSTIALLGLLAPWRSWVGLSANTLSQLEQAQQAIEAHEYDLARTHLGSYLEVLPFHAEAHFLMARTCRLTDDPDAWLYHLQIAQSLGWPLDQIALEYRLGEAQSKNIWIVEEGLKQDVLEAPPAEKLLIVEALINGYLVNDRPQDAYHLALAWTLESPDDWLAWLCIGRACQLNMSFDKAITSFEKVLELNPDQPQARLRLAQTFVVDRRFEQAIPQFQMYLKSNPGDPDALAGLANCQYSLGQIEAARATLDEVLRAHKNHPFGLLGRAQLELAEAPEKALPWLRQAVAVTPNDSSVLHSLVLALRAAHQDTEAEVYAQRLKNQQTKSSRLADLQMQIHQDANNVELRCQMATLHLELGNEEEAAHWFQAVLWIDPDHLPTLRALADYWRKHGDPRRAAYYAGRADGSIPRMSTP